MIQSKCAVEMGILMKKMFLHVGQNYTNTFLPSFMLVCLSPVILFNASNEAEFVDKTDPDEAALDQMFKASLA